MRQNQTCHNCARLAKMLLGDTYRLGRKVVDRDHSLPFGQTAHSPSVSSTLPRPRFGGANTSGDFYVKQ